MPADPRLRRTAVLLGVLSIPALILAAHLYVMYHAQGIGLDFVGIVVLELCHWYLWALAGPLVWRLALRWPVTGPGRARGIVRHAVAALVISVLVVAAYIATMILPTLSSRWSALRTIARSALALTGIKVTVTGAERLPRGNAVILFNHTSYMDAVIIASVLPGEPAFVAKKEFADQAFAGSFMRRLGVSFVERFDAAASLADAETVTGLAKAGRLFVFFPEGTFTRRAGLLGFYMGAFKVAAEANLPVVPGVLRGVRTLLRGDQWFPRRTPVSVVIEEPIQPSGTDFTAMLAMRDAARAAMLKHVGEPDLGALEKPAAPSG